MQVATAPAAPSVDGAPATPPATPPVAPPAGAPVAPPAAPAVVPPVTFDTPPVAPPVAPQDAVVVWEKTGDKALDVALRYVGQRGFGPDHPAMQAAMKGDFTEIEKALGALGEKAKDASEYVELAKESFGRRQAAAKSAGEAATKAVHDAVGGPAQWALIQPWIAVNADQKEKDEINAAFKAGGLAASTMAQYLAGLYKAHGPKGEKPKAAVKDTASSGVPSVGALSPKDYAKEVRTLSAKLGSKLETSPEYAQLQARRQAFRA